MDILDYTNYDNVRSLLGVNSRELADDTLGLEIYTNGLLAELEDVSYDVIPTYVEIGLIEETARSIAQQRFYVTARGFAAYAVAKQLTSSLPLFSPKEISDSKTLVGRFAANPYLDTITEVKEQCGLWRNRLLAALIALDTTVQPMKARNFMAVSGLSTDPVTG